MKKLLWAMLSLSLLFAACTKEENAPAPNLNNNNSELFFYGVAIPEGQISQQGVAQSNKLWNASAVITVRFLNDPYNMKDFVITHAREWEKHTCVRFEFVESGDAEVRIAFNWNNNSKITWSYTGNDCKQITDQSKPTLNFAGWNKANKTEAAKKGDVLRAFGQVMGLEYEYRHLAFDPMWDEYEVEDYWLYQQNIVDWDEMKKYVFDPMNSAKVIQTDNYDAQSIMVVPFPDYVSATSTAPFNTQLSATDIAFIQQLYPKSGCEEDLGEPILVIKRGVIGNLNIGISLTSNSLIDWGDGCIEVLASSTYDEYGAISWDYYTHNYESHSDFRTITIYGKTDAIVNIHIYQQDVYYLDVSKNEKLVHLLIPYNNLAEIDLSKNHELQSLGISGNNFRHINISNNPKLEKIEFLDTPITHIDFSNNLKLSSIACDRSLIEELNISHLPYCSYVRFANTPISKDLQKIIQLANSLPDRNSTYGGVMGYMEESTITTNNTFVSIITSKKWRIEYFPW